MKKFERREPLALEDISPLVDLDRPELKTEPWTPQPHPRFVGLDADTPAELFGEIKRDDILVHHPYHSFSTTVQAFLDAAAHDPATLAIKAAIYRTAPDSQVIQSLIEAAKNGKQVAVMIELKPRFDEENNLRWLKRLEEEGIHVAYGTIGLKTHSKVALVVRDEAVTPVSDPGLNAELDVILETMLADNRLRWTMQPDGSYVQRQPEGGPERNTHQILMQRAKDAAPRADRDANQPDKSFRREPTVNLDEVYLEESYDP